MSKIIIRNLLQEEMANISKPLTEYARGGKVLFLTDKPELAKGLNTINKDTLVAECVTSVSQSEIYQLKLQNPEVKTVIFHSGRLIDRYLNEILNVKRIKAKEYFQAWDVEVVIFSNSEGLNAMMSHNETVHGKNYYNQQNKWYVPRKRV